MPTSSVSAPGMQAVMLEQAQVRPGMRVLEIGSGGYNAALLAELAGPAGQRRHRRHRPAGHRPGPGLPGPGLADPAGHGGARGRRVRGARARAVRPDHRDRRGVGHPLVWVAQLAPGGRLVVPLRIRGLTRSAAFEPRDGHLASLSHLWCAFVPVQGAGARAEQRLLLDRSGVTVRTDDDVPGDAAMLGRALAGPAVAEWSGVRTGGGELDSLFPRPAGTLPRFGLLTRTRHRGGPGAGRAAGPAVRRGGWPTAPTAAASPT